MHRTLILGSDELTYSYLRCGYGLKTFLHKLLFLGCFTYTHTLQYFILDLHILFMNGSFGSMNEVCLTIQTNMDRSELLLGMTGRARERTEGRRGRVSFLLDVQGGPEHFLKLLVANLYIMTIKLQIILKQNSPGRPRPCPAWT